MWKEFTITRTDFKTSEFTDTKNCSLCKSARRTLGKKTTISAGGIHLRVNGKEVLLPRYIQNTILENTHPDYKGNNFKFKLNIPKQLL